MKDKIEEVIDYLVEWNSYDFCFKKLGTTTEEIELAFSSVFGGGGPFFVLPKNTDIVITTNTTMGGRGYWLKARTPGYKPEVDDLYYHRSFATGEHINTSALENELAKVENEIEIAKKNKIDFQALLPLRGNTEYFRKLLQSQINKQYSYFMQPNSVDRIQDKSRE